MTGIEQDREALMKLIDDSPNVVFFGGAGVSTESGIPDFRSKDGLYNQKYRYNPEEIISHHFFMREPEEFYRFYRERMLLLDKEPNPCHLYLAKLEKEGKLKAVVTQNIDGLHQKAGSCNVIELHGSIHRNFCMECHRPYDASFVAGSPNIVPRCSHCGGIVKPDVVLYEEPLDDRVMTKAMIAIMEADLLIVCGTSLVVYPAAGFLNYFQGRNLVLIDKNPEAKDARASLIIHQKAGELFGGML